MITTITGAVLNSICNNLFHAIWFYMLASKPRHRPVKMALICLTSALLGEGITLLGIFRAGIFARSYSVMYLIGTVMYACVFVFLLQGGKRSRALFTYFTYICFWAFHIVLALILAQNIFPASEHAGWMLRAIFNILSLLAYHFFCRKFLFEDREFDEKSSGLLLLVSGMVYLLLPVMMLFYAFSKQTPASLAVVLFMLVFCIAVYLLIFRLIRQMRRENELQMIEMQNRVMSETIRNFERSEQESRRLRHDRRHHIEMLSEYIKSGDMQAALHYLSQYRQQEQESAPETFCANRTMNNILRVYLRRARQEGIVVTTDIAMREDTAVADVDMVAILGNMLENAIHGCMTANGVRAMEVSIRHKDVKLVLQCRNSCAGDIPFENGLPVRKGGVGVSSILASAERYDGDVAFFERDGIFTCAVLLNDAK